MVVMRVPLVAGFPIPDCCCAAKDRYNMKPESGIMLRQEDKNRK